jgi:hypothetical protein
LCEGAWFTVAVPVLKAGEMEVQDLGRVSKASEVIRIYDVVMGLEVRFF